MCVGVHVCKLIMYIFDAAVALIKNTQKNKKNLLMCVVEATSDSSSKSLSLRRFYKK